MKCPPAFKKHVKTWQKQERSILEVSAEFVAAMEDVLDLYEEPYDPRVRSCVSMKAPSS